ncbi:hypothetical protein AVEN_204084-1 [Araneus ventricosus]|uniref:Uncharacterized protein n=1 Tax=Araneus ventricosus TaxID=182803 RepID=A0A4Y2NSX7_ARAVE|nr:hypothetical protein AVEN_204084-1 [Araneus ventricosus]
MYYALFEKMLSYALFEKKLRVFPPKVGGNWLIYAKQEQLSEQDVTKFLTSLADEVESDLAIEKIRNDTSDLNLLPTVARLKLDSQRKKMTPDVK